MSSYVLPTRLSWGHGVRCTSTRTANGLHNLFRVQWQNARRRSVLPYFVRVSMDLYGVLYLESPLRRPGSVRGDRQAKKREPARLPGKTDGTATPDRPAACDSPGTETGPVSKCLAIPDRWHASGLLPQSGRGALQVPFLAASPFFSRSLAAAQSPPSMGPQGTGSRAPSPPVRTPRSVLQRAALGSGVVARRL